jgi:small conductance mechanosensitive channel
MDPLEPLRRVIQDLIDPQRIATVIEVVLWLVIIALGAWVALRVSLSLVRRTTAWRSGHPAARMTPIVEGLLRYAIIFTALILMLSTLRVNITPVLASATVVGLTIGFGAQQIVRDLLAGIFLLSEGIVQIGDTVRLDTNVGVVERITLRVMQVRMYSGELVTVPNGTITKIGNLSRDYARAIVPILIPYDANVASALEALGDAARAWSADHASNRRAEPQIDGIVELRDTGVVVQCSVLVLPEDQWAVASELRQRVLEALARRGITPGVIAAAASPTSPPQSPGKST